MSPSHPPTRGYASPTFTPSRWPRQACSQAPATLPPPSAPDPCPAVTDPHMPCFASWFAPPLGAAELVDSFLMFPSPLTGIASVSTDRQTDSTVVHPSLLQPPAACAPRGASPAPLGAPAGNISAWGTGTSEQLASLAGSAAAHLQRPSGAAAGGALDSQAARGSRKAAMTAPRASASPR